MATAISEALHALRERVEAEHGRGKKFLYHRRPIGTQPKVVGKSAGGQIITEAHDVCVLVAMDEKGNPLPRVTPVEYFPDVHDAEPRQPE